MLIEKAIAYMFLKVSLKFRIPTSFNFAAVYQWNLQFVKNLAYFLTIYIVLSAINKTLRLNNLKTRTAMNGKISVFVICVEAIIYLLLYNMHSSIPLTFVIF